MVDLLIYEKKKVLNIAATLYIPETLTNQNQYQRNSEIINHK